MGIENYNIEERHFVEQTIKRAQRANETAERTEHKNRQHDNCRQNDKTVIVNHVGLDAAAWRQRHEQIGKPEIGAYPVAKCQKPFALHMKDKGKHHDKKARNTYFR